MNTNGLTSKSLLLVRFPKEIRPAVEAPQIVVHDAEYGVGVIGNPGYSIWEYLFRP
jgi:hypothetical protein